MRGSSEPIVQPDPSGAVAERGDGYLRLRLGPVFELDSRRLTALRDWLAATVAVSSQQFSGYGVDLSSGWFFVMIALAGTAIFVSSTIYPRLSAPRFFPVEQGMMLLAWVTIGVLVYASGGSNSPYIFFYAQTMFYSAYFFGSSLLAVAHVALGSLIALLPIAYDRSAAMDNEFIPTIAIALAVWWAMSAVVALKHRNTLRAERAARKLSLSDPLTGAANLRALEDFVASLDGRSYAVAMIDLEGLRAVNARDGYVAGDELIRRSAQALREACRSSDQVARIGGDEFLIVMPGIGAEGALRWRQRFEERMAIANNAAITAPTVAASVGTAATDGELASLAELIASADRELNADRIGAERRLDELVPPQARAYRMAARIDAGTKSRKRWRIEKLSAPTGVLVALAAGALTGLVIHLTGGPTSILISLVLVVVAYFAFFGNLKQTIVGVGSTLLAFAIAVFGSGSVNAVAQTRFSTIVFASLIIAYALQSNGRKLEIAEQHAEQLSLTDALTGLPNRRAFDQQFGEAIAELATQKTEARESFAGSPGLIVVDLENFKVANEVLGHHGGDDLLCQATDALRNAVGEDGMVFRVGGDEFAVIVFAHHVQRVEKFATRCFEAIRDIDGDGRYVARMVAVGAVVGYAYWTPGETAESLMDSAFEMMAAANPARLTTTAG